MSAISITASNVTLQSGPTEMATAGEAFAAGAAVYQSAAGTWLKAQCDGSTVEAGEVKVGVALFTADAASARGQVAVEGAEVNVGAVLTAGSPLYIHGTAGSMTHALADLASTNKSTIVGIAISTSRMFVKPIYRAGAVIA